MVSDKCSAQARFVGTESFHRLLKELGDRWVWIHDALDKELKALLGVSAELLVHGLGDVVVVLAHVCCIDHLEKLRWTRDERADEHFFVRTKPSLAGLVQLDGFFFSLGRRVEARVVRQLLRLQQCHDHLAQVAAKLRADGDREVLVEHSEVCLLENIHLFICPPREDLHELRLVRAHSLGRVPQELRLGLMKGRRDHAQQATKVTRRLTLHEVLECLVIEHLVSHGDERSLLGRLGAEHRDERLLIRAETLAGRDDLRHGLVHAWWIRHIGPVERIARRRWVQLDHFQIGGRRKWRGGASCSDRKSVV